MSEALGSTHQRVRRLRRLVQKRSLRWSEGVCVLEGPDLIDAALASGVEFEALYVDETVASPAIRDCVQRARAHGVRVFTLEPGVLEKIADAKTPQPILAAVRFTVTSLRDVPSDGLLLVLHELRDPGNAGTIIRSADAAGVRAVVLTGDSVDPFNPKTLRATAGSIFHLPIVVTGLGELWTHCQEHGVETIATVVRGGESHRSLDLTRPSAILIGNEAEGLDAEVVAHCARRCTITMAGENESLNAGVAAALIAFEAFYQREDASGVPIPPSL